MPVKRNKRLKAVSSETERITRSIRKKRGLSEAALISDWIHIVGPILSAECFPTRLTRNKDAVGGILHIRVSGALALELQHMQPQVIERVNQYFGHEALSALSLHQGPIADQVVEEAPSNSRQMTKEKRTLLDKQLMEVIDDELRLALNKLGEGILSKKVRSE